jgi:hypothetical protein
MRIRQRVECDWCLRSGPGYLYPSRHARQHWVSRCDACEPRDAE